ncbi:AAA family ATPase [Candidatus Parcubacteria bacterium]|nr:AAA family ATPase [Candidatus Parcubacteria bacterium]
MTQKEALDILKLGHNVYLTGSAGSGKTYLLNEYIKYLKEHDVVVAITASTGIAASHMNGVTIHSWSGLGVRSSLSPYDLEAMEEKRYLWDRFQKTKVLIIDEISMLHHYRLDLVDQVTRFFKRADVPFGGMQVILCGDFFQLPPVSRNNEPPAHFAYHSDSWKGLDLKVCYLTESHRHNDQNFLSVLNAIRQNTLTAHIISHLTGRFNKEPAYEIRPTKLYTHNIDVDAINQAELEKIEGVPFRYGMTEEGRPPLVAALKSSCLAHETLTLKRGAQVMFVKNDPEGKYVNGTLGTVIECNREYPVVKTVRGDKIRAEPVEWRIEEEGKVKAKIKQVPLRLAWAITIHKSQGMTLDAAEIDLSKSFEKGMGYVALSRVKSLDGLKLLGLNDNALEINEEILMFDEDLQVESERIAEALSKLDPKEKEELQQKFLAHISPRGKEKKQKKVKGGTYLETKRMILEKMSVKDIAAARKLGQETIVGHVEKLLLEGSLSLSDIEYLKSAIPPDRLATILAAFHKLKKIPEGHYLGSVKTMLPPDYTFQEIRLARLFIKK